MHQAIDVLVTVGVVLVLAVVVMAGLLLRAMRAATRSAVAPPATMPPATMQPDRAAEAGIPEVGTAGPDVELTQLVEDDAVVVAARLESARAIEAAHADADRIVAAAQDRARVLQGEVAAAGAQVATARETAAGITAKAEQRREEAIVEVRQLRDDLAAQRHELERREQRFDDRDRRLAAELDRLQTVRGGLEAREAELAVAEAAAAAAQEAHRAELERIAGLTSEQARSELLGVVEVDTRRSAAIMARDIEAAAKTGADRTARGIIATAIQRLASEQTSESVVTTVALAADEIKGRIIGREGRNIRAFEQITGVNVIIDDTPDAVLLSCFDPVRRETARVALESLVADGRIHPHRIEETYAIAVREVEALCQRAAEDALLEVGISDLHPELVTVLGHLRYRTSYGQNVLRHLVECSHLAGLMAVELGIDPVLPRRCAFLHDIGKALTHEVEGSHALVGADLARRHGEHPDVVHAIEAHHNEVEPRTVEALLTQAADGISGGRPGARRESLEAYVKRLHRLEEIGLAHPGVEKVYAMQAGREVRVMVLPDHVDDLAAQVMAREIVKQIEDELTYPGQIRVTVVRESRATEVAR